MTADLFLRMAQRALAVPPSGAVTGGLWEEEPWEDERWVEVEARPAAPEQAVESAASGPPAPSPGERPAVAQPAPPSDLGLAPPRRQEGGPAAPVGAVPINPSLPAGSGQRPGPAVGAELIRPAAPARPPSGRPALPPRAARRTGTQPGATLTPAGIVSPTCAVLALPRLDLPTLQPHPDPSGVRSAPVPPGPVVEVTIDRVDVRVDRLAAPSSRPAAPEPALSLDDYLARRR